jgi:peptidyl-dipeptidase A
MMSLGFSKSWPEALKSMTGSPEMSARSFIKYFLPLYKYLKQENSANDECIGWGSELVG